jgi:hypothetical protein
MNRVYIFRTVGNECFESNYKEFPFQEEKTLLEWARRNILNNTMHAHVVYNRTYKDYKLINNELEQR